MQRVDDNVATFLGESDDPDLFYDMRRLNGRPNDESPNTFWEELKKFFESSVVHERRQGEIAFLPVDMSINDIIGQVKDRLPQGTRCPSE